MAGETAAKPGQTTGAGLADIGVNSHFGVATRWYGTLRVTLEVSGGVDDLPESPMTNQPEDSAVRVYRPRRSSFVTFWVVVGVVGVFGVSLAVAMFWDAGHSISPQPHSPATVILLAFSLIVMYAVYFVVVVWTFYRLRIVADDHGITVVNYASTRQLRWGEISGIDSRPGYSSIVIHLKDGSMVMAKALQKSNLMRLLGSGARFDQVVSQLNAELAERTGSSLSPPPPASSTGSIPR